MELVDHIRKISFVFFVLLGTAHFLAGLLFARGYWVNETLLVNRALFIPFVVTLLAYAFSNIKYHLLAAGKTSAWTTYLFIGVSVVVFAGLIALEILVPDSSILLLPNRL